MLQRVELSVMTDTDEVTADRIAEQFRPIFPVSYSRRW